MSYWHSLWNQLSKFQAVKKNSSLLEIHIKHTDIPSYVLKTTLNSLQPVSVHTAFSLDLLIYRLSAFYALRNTNCGWFFLMLRTLALRRSTLTYALTEMFAGISKASHCSALEKKFDPSPLTAVVQPNHTRSSLVWVILNPSPCDTLIQLFFLCFSFDYSVVPLRLTPLHDHFQHSFSEQLWKVNS